MTRAETDSPAPEEDVALAPPQQPVEKRSRDNSLNIPQPDVADLTAKVEGLSVADDYDRTDDETGKDRPRKNTLEGKGRGRRTPNGFANGTRVNGVNARGGGFSRKNANGVRKDGSSTRAATYKTEICRSHRDLGYCEYEDKCQFAHGVEQLRPRKFSPKYKTQLCKNYHKYGNCRFGSRCQFIHDEQRIQVSTNEFWLISPSENLVRIEVVDKGVSKGAAPAANGAKPAGPNEQARPVNQTASMSPSRKGPAGSEVMTLPMHEAMPMAMSASMTASPMNPTPRPPENGYPRYQEQPFVQHEHYHPDMMMQQYPPHFAHNGSMFYGPPLPLPSAYGRLVPMDMQNGMMMAPPPPLMYTPQQMPPPQGKPMMLQAPPPLMPMPPSPLPHQPPSPPAKKSNAGS